MKVEPLKEMVCPLDGTALAEIGRSLRCAEAHSFDFAREGYVNLLPVQWKASKAPGDNALMSAARHRFLASGAYRPLVDQMFELLRKELPADADARIVDAGCGEGEYLRQIAVRAANLPGERTLFLGAYDISKDAVRIAAKTKGPIAYAVAGHRHAPYAPASLDGLLCTFAFPDWAAFRGLLKTGGFLLRVEAGGEHLLELRRLLYAEVREERARREEPATGFTMVKREKLTFGMKLVKGELIGDLFRMTPHYYRADEARKNAVLALKELAVTADFALELWRAV